MCLVTLGACRRTRALLFLYSLTQYQCVFMEYYQWIVREKLGLWLQLVVAASGFCLPNKTVHRSSSDNSSCPCGYRGRKSQLPSPFDGPSRWERDPRKAGQNLTHLDSSYCLASLLSYGPGSLAPQRPV